MNKKEKIVYEKAMKWIRTNSINGNGIATLSGTADIYPEVTGYYIPSLLEWDEKELAVAYAKYLCVIQKTDGSWYDPSDSAPYVFDSAQVLKGLISIRNILPEVDVHIIKGCDWVVSNMKEDGRLTTPTDDAWGNDENFCSELIHTYCLTPLRDAAEIFGRPDYRDAADKILAYYLENYKEKIENFSLMAHFYAYVMEGLHDLGEVELVRKCMLNLEKYQNSKGGISGLNNVPWVCSTALFQLALVWYKLGELKKGNRIFTYACKLQNESGGWYGSYPASKFWNKYIDVNKRPSYFPDREISWANKFFLDALAYKNKLEEL